MVVSAPSRGGNAPFRLFSAGLLAVLVFSSSASLRGQDRKPLDFLLQSKESVQRQQRDLNEMRGQPVTWRVQYKVALSEIPAGAKEVLVWLSLPSDEAHQSILSLSHESVPGDWSVVPDLENRASFLASRITDPSESRMEFVISWIVRRAGVFTDVKPEQVSVLSELDQSALREHLRKDAPHMVVNEKVQAIADEVCGDETNIALQALAIMNHIAASVDHYSNSNDPDMPRCGVGDAQNCLAQGGGCCTDLNSLFIALARARGIPARLQMGFRLLEKNEEQWTDPGYRCWVEYYVPTYGWVSADIVEAESLNREGTVQWLTGLTPRRVQLNQGREFRLFGAHAEKPVNLATIGYAEIDGVPARVLPEGDLLPQLTRQVYFERVSDGSEPLTRTADSNREKSESGSLPSTP